LRVDTLDGERDACDLENRIAQRQQDERRQGFIPGLAKVCPNVNKPGGQRQYQAARTEQCAGFLSSPADAFSRLII
jgi:hypothetical protein